MMDGFVTFATNTGYVSNVVGVPGVLYVSGQAVIEASKRLYRLYIWFSKRKTCLVWYLHCSRYCVKQIANGFVLRRNKSKNSDGESQPTSEEASNHRPDIPLRTVANENDIPTTEADQLRTAVQDIIKMATLQGKEAERDDSEKKKLQTELDTLKDKVAKNDASEKKLQTELDTLKGKVEEKDASKKILQTELDTLKGKVAKKDASKINLQTELDTLKGKVEEKDASKINLQTELDTLKGKVAEKDASKDERLAEVRAAHFEERTS
jgi:chromosome segregation ATPase